jgi:hypothetical protein
MLHLIPCHCSMQAPPCGRANAGRNSNREQTEIVVVVVVQMLQGKATVLQTAGQTNTGKNQAEKGRIWAQRERTQGMHFLCRHRGSMAHNTFLSRQPAYITTEPPLPHNTHTGLVAQLLRLPVSAHTHAAVATAASAMRACATQLPVNTALHVTYPNARPRVHNIHPSFPNKNGCTRKKGHPPCCMRMLQTQGLPTACGKPCMQQQHHHNKHNHQDKLCTAGG